jgi:hypothetical protein
MAHISSATRPWDIASTFSDPGLRSMRTVEAASQQRESGAGWGRVAREPMQVPRPLRKQGDSQ